VGEYLKKFPPRDTMPKLFSGSWINHNFAIWIGHEEDRRAWDALHETREYLKRRSARGGIAAEHLEKAWRELYIAEGSDWFWWFGDDHSSAQDAMFDYLFRKHLQNVYVLLGDTPPVSLAQPIATGFRRKIHSDPRRLLDVRVDGRFSYFEWIDAGQYVSASDRGTMTRVTQGLVRSVWFGFDNTRLLLRMDLEGNARSVLQERAIDGLRIEFVVPGGLQLVASQLSSTQPEVELITGDVRKGSGQIEIAADKIIELCLPIELLGVKPDHALGFFVELRSGEAILDRAPREATIDLIVPSPDFERIMWQV
jgi:hypothetical protein